MFKRIVLTQTMLKPHVNMQKRLQESTYVSVSRALRVLGICKHNKSWKDEVSSDSLWVVRL